MKRTVFCAALLLAAGCSSPKKNRTVDPLRVETIVAAPSADVEKTGQFSNIISVSAGHRWIWSKRNLSNMMSRSEG